MYTPKRTVPEAALAAFQPEEIPPALEGLTAALLADLYHLVMKFGTADSGDARVKHFVLHHEQEQARITGCSRSGVARLMVAYGMTTEQGAHTIPLPDGFVIWDQQVSVSHIETMVTSLVGMLMPLPTPEHLRRRKQVVMGILRERGITLERIEHLTVDDITDIRDEISRRMQIKEGESPS
ncbi:hypothetical protein HY491_02390 [Candidatus Woesearchaeota archaeon]|nr:hypothetical protein [Candidatus Woesearchaeota archaeon]